MNPVHFEGLALHDCQEESVHLRVAEKDGRLFIDIADERWRAVEIDADGWRIVDNPPVRFRRPRGMLPLPEPKRGGSLDQLRPFLNVAGDDGWRLEVAWLLASLRPRGPYLLMVLNGQQGSAKSTTARVLRSMADGLGHASTENPLPSSKGAPSPPRGASAQGATGHPTTEPLLIVLPPQFPVLALQKGCNVIAIDAFNAEIDREKEDAAYLDGVRHLMHRQLAGVDGLDGTAEDDDEAENEI